jgi:hypothetical protein
MGEEEEEKISANIIKIMDDAIVAIHIKFPPSTASKHFQLNTPDLFLLRSRLHKKLFTFISPFHRKFVNGKKKSCDDERLSSMMRRAATFQILLTVIHLYVSL